MQNLNIIGLIGALRNCLLLLALSALPSFATTYYVSQAGGGFSGGSACNGQTTESVATFNTQTLNPGDVAYFCGTITSQVTQNGAGTSGNVITLNWDTGAKISLPFCSGGACLSLGGAYITLNGGSPCGPTTSCSTTDSGTGIIEETANGAALAHQSCTDQAILMGGGNTIIENLIIRNIYVRVNINDAQPCGAGDAKAILNGSQNNQLVHDCTFHDMGTGWGETGDSSNITFHDNYLYNFNWGFQTGTGTNSPPDTNYFVYKNKFGSTAIWDDTADHNHHDQVFFFDNVANGGTFTNVFIYNNTFVGPYGINDTGAIFFGGGQEQAYIFNNVFSNIGNSTSPVNAYIEATGEASQIIHSYNNTVMGAGPAVEDANGTNCTTLQGHLTSENNAFQACATLVQIQNGTYGTGSPTIVLVDYNAYANGSTTNTWQDASGIFYIPSGTSPFIPTGWITYTGGEAHSFYNSSSLSLNSNGSPQSNSPVIGVGTNLYSVCNGQAIPGLGALCSDINGNARPSSGAWDMGAFNYASSGPAAPTNITVTPGRVRKWIDDATDF